MRAITLILVTLLGLAASATYKGYKVYKLEPKTESQRAYLNSLVNSPYFDFWSKIDRIGSPVTVMVTPQMQKKFEGYLYISKMEYEIIIHDVESNIEAEREYHRSRPATKAGKISFDQYQRHSAINNYLTELAVSHPDLVSLENIGQSYQGRDMVLIRISTGATTPAKPVIFVDAGIHAREWIAPATALYLIQELVENTANRNLIENVDWVILPVVNPDGYEYCWTNERLWRKTRSPGTSCVGADPNRNFDFHWMEVGASSSECSEIYAGRTAFSEVETRNLRDYLLKTANIVQYLTLHSYGQYLLYPWGWTSALPANSAELDALAQDVNRAIRAVSGTSYTIGSSTNVLYAAAGASDDWAMGVGGIDIVYTIELPGGGFYGFDLPASSIRGVVTETFEGFKVFANYALTQVK